MGHREEAIYLRTFIALELPEVFRFETAGLARQLAAAVEGRFVDPAGYHVTLAFLGDVGERDIAQAMDVVASVAERTREVPLTCDGLGKFGRPHDATLWLGLRPNEQLVRVAADVRAGLAARAVAFDEKAFTPHITLARRAAIPSASLPALAFPEPDRACALTLFKSELSPEGSIYHALLSRVL